MQDLNLQWCLKNSSRVLRVKSVRRGWSKLEFVVKGAAREGFIHDASECRTKNIGDREILQRNGGVKTVTSQRREWRPVL